MYPFISYLKYFLKSLSGGIPWQCNSHLVAHLSVCSAKWTYFQKCATWDTHVWLKDVIWPGISNQNVLFYHYMVVRNTKVCLWHWLQAVIYCFIMMKFPFLYDKAKKFYSYGPWKQQQLCHFPWNQLFQSKVLAGLLPTSDNDIGRSMNALYQNQLMLNYLSRWQGNSVTRLGDFKWFGWGIFC